MRTFRRASGCGHWSSLLQSFLASGPASFLVPLAVMVVVEADVVINKVLG